MLLHFANFFSFIKLIQGLEKLNDQTTREYFRSTNRHQNIKNATLHQIILRRIRIEAFETNGHLYTIHQTKDSKLLKKNDREIPTSSSSSEEVEEMDEKSEAEPEITETYTNLDSIKIINTNPLPGQSSKEQLLQGIWLNDTDIFSFMIKLKRMFPNIQGMEDPVVIKHQPHMIDKMKDFYRILHSRSNHWILITGNSDSNELNIYDSLYRRKIEDELGDTISKIVTSNVVQNDHITFRVQRVQKQNLDFCGYFALSNLTALCFGLDPELLLFDENQIRAHFISIIYNFQPLTMFPHVLKTKKTGKLKTIVFEVP